MVNLYGLFYRTLWLFSGFWVTLTLGADELTVLVVCSLNLSICEVWKLQHGSC